MERRRRRDSNRCVTRRPVVEVDEGAQVGFSTVYAKMYEVNLCTRIKSRFAQSSQLWRCSFLITSGTREASKDGLGALVHQVRDWIPRPPLRADRQTGRPSRTGST